MANIGAYFPYDGQEVISSKVDIKIPSVYFGFNITNGITAKVIDKRNKISKNIETFVKTNVYLKNHYDKDYIHNLETKEVSSNVVSYIYSSDVLPKITTETNVLSKFSNHFLKDLLYKINLRLYKYNITGLITYVSFNDETPNDSISNKNGTWHGNELYENGIIGKAAKFDGSSYIAFPSVTTSLPMTITMWIKTDQISTGPYDWAHPCLIGFATNGYNSNDFGIEIKNGYLHIFSGFGVEKYYTTSAYVADNKWHFIAVVFDTKECRAYVDGKKVGSFSQNSNKISNFPWYMGCMDSNKINIPVNNSYYKGLIDEFKVFQNAFTDEEIYYLYQSELSASKGNNKTVLLTSRKDNLTYKESSSKIDTKITVPLYSEVKSKINYDCTFKFEKYIFAKKFIPFTLIYKNYIVHKTIFGHIINNASLTSYIYDHEPNTQKIIKVEGIGNNKFISFAVLVPLGKRFRIYLGDFIFEPISLPANFYIKNPGYLIGYMVYKQVKTAILKAPDGSMINIIIIPDISESIYDRLPVLFFNDKKLLEKYNLDLTKINAKVIESK